MPAAPHGVYRCAPLGDDDDRWVAISVRTQGEWERFVNAIGAPPWTSDAKFQTLYLRMKNHTELDAHLARWTRERSAEDAMMILQRAKVAAGVVSNGADICARDPQLKERGYWASVKRADGEQSRIVGIPVQNVGHAGIGANHRARCRREHRLCFGRVARPHARRTRRADSLGRSVAVESVGPTSVARRECLITAYDAGIIYGMKSAEQKITVHIQKDLLDRAQRASQSRSNRYRPQGAGTCCRHEMHTIVFERCEGKLKISIDLDELREDRSIDSAGYEFNRCVFRRRRGRRIELRVR